MRALVIGGDSKLGRALCTRLLARGHEVTKTTRRTDLGAPVRRNERIVQLDMLDPVFHDDLLNAFDKFVVYIMAAITGVVPAETYPDAWRINAEAPVALALQAKDRFWHVVFMSSGTVELAPHTASAMQKRYVELVIHMIGGCVVRPLPVVPPDKYDEVADLLVNVGEQRRTGVVRWEG